LSVEKSYDFLKFWLTFIFVISSKTVILNANMLRYYRVQNEKSIQIKK